MQDGNGTQGRKSPKHSPRSSTRGGSECATGSHPSGDKTIKELLLTTRFLQSELDKLKLINHKRRQEAFGQIKKDVERLKQYCAEHDIKWTECRVIWDREDNNSR